MSEVIPKDQIAGYECRFAVHVPTPKGQSDDFHLVKEIIHTKDGRQIPTVKPLFNFKRPYWVAKKGTRNYNDKKEWTKLEDLDRYTSTQSDLVYNAARTLGQQWFRGNLKQLARSPYLYGADILSTAVIKKAYQKRYPDLLTPYTIAAFDTEKDVVMGTKKIIMASLTMKEKVFTAISKEYLAGIVDPEARIQQLMDKYLGEVIERRGIKPEIVVVEDDVEIIRECFKRAHEWKPDFVSIWNMDFDIPFMIDTLKARGIDPAEIFSDPCVPEAYRYFKYRPGQSQKVTASGKVTPIKPPARWHTVYCPASFYFIDGMCAYKHIRIGEGEEPSYGLDAILKKHECGGKLKFEEAGHLDKIDWHIFMQTYYKLEYVVYNQWDCISMEELDEKTLDLSMTLPLFSGCSDFANFRSQPRRTADNLHWFCLDQEVPHVVGTTSDQMRTELDEFTVSTEGWIITLAAHLVADNGLQVIREIPLLRTNIRGHVGDLDVSASYPNGGAVFNMSKETTHKEICMIRGIDEFTQRMQGINLSGGATNAVEFCSSMYQLPTMKEMHAIALEEMKGERAA